MKQFLLSPSLLLCFWGIYTRYCDASGCSCTDLKPIRAAKCLMERGATRAGRGVHCSVQLQNIKKQPFDKHFQITRHQNVSKKRKHFRQKISIAGWVVIHLSLIHSFINFFNPIKIFSDQTPALLYTWTLNKVIWSGCEFICVECLIRIDHFHMCRVA